MTLQEIKDYLKIDDNSQDVFIQDLITISQTYIDSMVGEAYKVDKKAMSLAKLLQYKIVADMHESRSTEVDNETKQDKIVTSILDKLSNYTEE